ncbi:MAG: hypothetical protein FWB85_08440 [Chitinispirillia bacterium]|nr:hypothetical protein [Chitinispirillia bacterium]
MEHVAFEPWVGKNYSKNGYDGKKILILGESHYCDSCSAADNEKCCSDMTNKVINDYLNYKNGRGDFVPWMNTFTRFTNVFLDKTCDTEEINNFWNSVIFYNYVQRELEGPRKSPTKEMFKMSEKAFFEVLDEHAPDIIIAWGERLNGNMPDCGYPGKKSIFGDELKGKIYYYKTKTKDILIYYIAHPSSTYFSREEYAKYLREVRKL